MVQLRVEDSGNVYFLDLYEEEPIKLTLSIEDITDTTARSVFSRTFRVPATGNNNGFFKHAFMISGIDYDVTVKKPATILVDGQEFRIGHIRLQKIYVNSSKNTNEYEIVFLGETADFATALGEKKLGDLDLTAFNHDLTYANITTSWQAYPQGGPTSGLLNGDILYPLVDFGDHEVGGKVAYTGQTSGGGFNHTQNALERGQFKPMIRAKALWDKIFEEAGFSYESQIADSGQFRALYVSAFGNEPGEETNAGSANLLDVGLSTNYQWSGTDVVIFDVETLDPSDNYNPLTGIYTVPETGRYEITARVSGETLGEVGGGAIVVRLKNGGTTLDSDTITIPSNRRQPWTSVTHYYLSDPDLIANDQIYIEVEEAGDVSMSIVNVTSYFKVTEAPGEVGLASLFDEDYKQIDFIKDMITKFRLVLAPKKNDPKTFIVEPWVDYIASGDVYDWSDKMDHSSDLQIEPVFFSQSDRIQFSDAEDEDFLNDKNQKQFKEVFGTLKFESGNELLKGSREIKTGFAPTPISQIRGAQDSNFLIPLLYTTETEVDDAGVPVFNFPPVKPKTRLLFYNGLKTQTKTTAWPSNQGNWFFLDESTGIEEPQTQFPMVSYWEDFDSVTGPGIDTINLNWQIEPGYAYPYAQFAYTDGQSMYTRFWANYIESIYNKFARKVTAQFVLSAYDLQDFSFDDVIFLDGNYYRPERITDVVLGEKSVATVELIKLLDYASTVPPTPPADPCDEAPPVSATISHTNESAPGANDGTLTITPQGGISPYEVTVTGPGGYNYNQTGVTGTVNLTGLAGGSYQITIEDDCEQNVIYNRTISTVPAGNYYLVTSCVNPGDTIVASYSPGGLTVGQACKISIDPAGCYEIVGPTTGPGAATILSVYTDCASCPV